MSLRGFGPGVGDELLDRRGGHGRMNHQHVLAGGDQRDGREVAQRIVGQARVQGLGDRERADVAEEQRVAVGVAFRHDFAGYGAARARAGCR